MLNFKKLWSSKNPICEGVLDTQNLRTAALSSNQTCIAEKTEYRLSGSLTQVTLKFVLA